MGHETASRLPHLDKMLTTFINTLVKAAENEAQTHFGKNLEEVLKHFMAKVNSDFEKQCLLWYFTKKGQTMTVPHARQQPLSQSAQRLLTTRS